MLFAIKKPELPLLRSFFSEKFFESPWLWFLWVPWLRLGDTSKRTNLSKVRVFWNTFIIELIRPIFLTTWFCRELFCFNLVFCKQADRILFLELRMQVNSDYLEWPIQTFSIEWRCSSKADVFASINVLTLSRQDSLSVWIFSFPCIIWKQRFFHLVFKSLPEKADTLKITHRC